MCLVCKHWGLDSLGRPGEFDEPVGIAFNAETNRLYVADTWNQRMQSFLSIGVDGAYANMSQWDVDAWYGKDFEKIPAGAIGMYSYIDRMKQGLQQLMAGSRKFALEYIDRGDLVALTRDAADISGIPFVMDSDKEEVDKILGFK